MKTVVPHQTISYFKLENMVNKTWNQRASRQVSIHLRYIRNYQAILIEELARRFS